MLPEFFGDEWHEGVWSRRRRLSKKLDCGFVACAVDRFLIVGLDHFGGTMRRIRRGRGGRLS